MNDTQLVVLSREIDNLIAQLCIEHKTSPLSLVAIINARLIWACRETDSEQDYLNLMEIISGGVATKELPQVSRH